MSKTFYSEDIGFLTVIIIPIEVVAAGDNSTRIESAIATEPLSLAARTA